MTNTGNVTLSGITLVDSDFGLSSCTIPAALAPNASFTCTISTSAVAGQHADTATADSTQSGPDSDDAYYFGIADVGQITPTGTTCTQYITGTAIDFDVYYASQGGVVQYQIKRNVISATNPGVFFYWTGLSQTITGTGPVFIAQSDNNTNIGPFAPVPNDIKLWLVTGTTCTQVQLADSQFQISGGDVTVDIATAAPAGSYYAISVKYDTGSVVGQSAAGKPTVKFSFTTDVGDDGSIEETDTKGITLAPKK